MESNNYYIKSILSAHTYRGAVHAANFAIAINAINGQPISERAALYRALLGKACEFNMRVGIRRGLCEQIIFCCTAPTQKTRGK